MLTKIRSYANRPLLLAGLVTALIVGTAQAASAQFLALTITSNVASDFHNVQTTLTGYIVAGAIMVVTLALIVVGILMVVRWARRAARS